VRRTGAARLIVALGWAALFAVAGFRVAANYVTHRDVVDRLTPGSVYLRDDFVDGVDASLWQEVLVHRLLATCIYPKERVTRGGVLVLGVRDAKSSCAGFTRHMRGELLASAQRFPLPFRLEARLQVASAPGVVTGLFTYSDPTDGTPHFENDIEFPGARPERRLGWLNEFAPWLPPRQGNEQREPLSFDASREFHDYSIDVHPWRTEWRIDGELVRTSENITEAVPQGVNLNVWFTPFWSGLYSKASPRSAAGTRHALLDWIEVTSLPEDSR
jgi:beta-glucanase (GH16 family)